MALAQLLEMSNPVAPATGVAPTRTEGGLIDRLRNPTFREPLLAGAESVYGPAGRDATLVMLQELNYEDVSPEARNLVDRSRAGEFDRPGRGGIAGFFGNIFDAYGPLGVPLIIGGIGAAGGALGLGATTGAEAALGADLAAGWESTMAATAAENAALGGFGAEAAGAAGGLGALSASGGGTAAGTGLGGASLGSGITTGAGGITGLTPGVASTSIGGGALGSGIGAGAGGASAAGLGAAGATGLGALGSGFFAGETMAPVLGGASGTLSTAGGAPLGASGGGTAAGGGTAGAGASGALSRIISGNGTTEDYLSVLGQAAPALIGAAGANAQANAMERLANRYLEMGAPYRTRLESTYADPSAYLTSPEVTVPVQQGTDALARALSVQGNPAGSGTALQELQNYATNQFYGRLGQERDRLAGYGGLTAYNAAAPGAASSAVNAQRGVYDAIGAGTADVLNPPRGMQDIYRSMRTAGLI